nr:serine/threonine protein kinase [Planctomycetota bacterium]
MAIAEDREDREDADRPLPGLPDLPGLPAAGAAPPRPGGTGGLKPTFGDHADPSPANEPPALPPARPQPAAEPSPSLVDEDQYLGRNFGGFELVAKIGQGGMGVVYKGRQVSLDRVVAIKILSKALGDNSEFIKRFEREAKSIARISHPNIVAVYDFGKHEGLWYMVTEFIEGSNLAKIINEKLVLQVEEVMPLVVNCLAGLAHVSQSGIIHRDIKPDNILLTKDQVAKIADFGLAKDVTSDSDLTAVGLAMGTPSYMSPEQCMGRRLDVRSDVYSLGVTAYFALTGEKPFVGQSSFEIMTKQREYTPPPPVQLNPRVPKDASALVMRMIAKNPNDRFTDAADCRDAWIELGQTLGLMGPVTRSGEYRFTPAEMARLKASAAEGQQAAPFPPPAFGSPGSAFPPPPPLPASPPALPPGPAMGDLPNLSEAEREASGARPLTERKASSDNMPAAAVRSPSTDRRGARPSVATEALTCPKCGMLNRGDLKACQRCAASLRGDQPMTAKEQESEAQQLFEQGRYVDAAQLFAKLADKEQDRKQRSIMRSREREARKLALEQQVTEQEGRAQGMVDHGDLRGAIVLLEKLLGNIRDGGGGTSEATIADQIATLKGRIAAGRRLRMALMTVIALAALGAAGWWGWTHGWFAMSKSAAPRAPAAPVTPEG